MATTIENHRIINVIFKTINYAYSYNVTFVYKLQVTSVKRK